MNTQNKPTILYVDDEMINLELFKITFNTVFNTITAKSAYEGLKLIDKEDNICIVISDMKMPKMTGLEFIKELKKKRPDLPCFILSGYDKNAEIAKAIEDNLIEDYFMKPFDRAKLEKYITKSIETTTKTAH